MPRPSKGARLWRRPVRRKNGKIVAASVWIIKDGDRHIATGCLASATQEKAPIEAEQALHRYLTQKYQPNRRVRDIEQIDVADVLSVYLADLGDERNEFEDFDARVGRLNEYWGGKMLSEINAHTCKGYVKHRPSPGGARRDLEALRAAINHHSKQNLHYGTVRISLPARGEPRSRWLERSEAARLISACWRYREKQTVHVGTKKGEIVSTERRPLRHIARFILIGLYTGTRAASIAAASPYQDLGRSFVDLDRGVFYRLPIGKKRTKKRQPPTPLPARLLAHMRRWVRLGIVIDGFVEWNGKPVKSVKKGFARGVRLAQLLTGEGNVTPHTLRHTAATWAMQNGTDPWKAAGFLGMSVEVLLGTYGHHHPDYLRDAAANQTAKPRKGISVVETVVDLEARKKMMRKTP